MAAHGPKAPQDILIREDVTERPEHRDRHIERAAQVERAHIPLNEPQGETFGARLASRHGENRTGRVETRYLEPAAEEREGVIPRPAPEVEERPGPAMRVTTEDPLKKRHIPLVVHDAMVQEVVVLRETVVRSTGHPTSEPPSPYDIMAFESPGPHGLPRTVRGDEGRRPRGRRRGAAREPFHIRRQDWRRHPSIAI